MENNTSNILQLENEIASCLAITSSTSETQLKQNEQHLSQVTTIIYINISHS